MNEHFKPRHERETLWSPRITVSGDQIRPRSTCRRLPSRSVSSTRGQYVMRSGGQERSGETDLVAKRASKTTLKQAQTLADKLRRQMREHPARTVATAVGIGYVLGGGLFSRLTARIVGTGIRIGLRTALLPFVTEGLLMLGEKHTTQRET